MREERRKERGSLTLGLRIPRFAWDSAHPQWPHCVARAVGAQGNRMRGVSDGLGTAVVLSYVLGRAWAQEVF